MLKIEIVKRVVFLTLGAILASIAIEMFLVPNHIIDGGILGISIILSYLSKISLGIVVFVLNLPFLYLAYSNFGRIFVISTLYSVSVLAISLGFFHGNIATSDALLLGIGVGLILRNQGSLDGTEIIAINAAKKTSFSVGEIIMFFNIFILSSAGLVFTWDRAMYSLIAYFVAFKTIDVVLEGLEESKSVMIISNNPMKIGKAIIEKWGIAGL